MNYFPQFVAEIRCYSSSRLVSTYAAVDARRYHSYFNPRLLLCNVPNTPFGNQTNSVRLLRVFA